MKFEKLGCVPPKEFEEWCSCEFNPSNTYHLSKMVDKGISPEELNRAVKKAINEVMENARNSPVLFSINHHVNREIWLDFSKFNETSISPAEIASKKTRHFSLLSISQPKQELIINEAGIGSISLSTSNGSIKLINCCINSLNISDNHMINLTLDNCWVNQLIIGPSSIKNLSVKNGWLCSVDCPSPDGGNPFTGTIIFSEVSFPTSASKSKLFEGPQQYRNLRSHLEVLQNVPATSLMRAKELESESETDKYFTKWFSWTYFQVTGYGLFPGRAFCIFCIISMVTFLIILILDGGTIGLNREFYTGWREVYKEDGLWARVIRSFSLTLQSMLNPFGIFGSYKAVIPNTGVGKIWLTIHGIIADGVLAFFIFAIRKRFKLS